MKKIAVFVLLVALLLPMVPLTDANAVAEKPFYGLGWSDVNRRKFANMDGLVNIGITAENGVVSLSYARKTDMAEIAKSVKAAMDARPEGMRYLHFWTPSKAYRADPESVIYLDKMNDQLKEQFSSFLKEYHALGGKLEGVVVDVEYLEPRSWWIYAWVYSGGKYEKNTNIYNDIVNDPRYATEVRPLLEERGFVFYEDVGGLKSEIYSIFPNAYLPAAERKKYENCVPIWDAVMETRMANYLNESMYEPLKNYYPDASFSDYQIADTAAWMKNLADSGNASYTGGNRQKAGNVSNFNTYSSRPNQEFYQDGQGSAIYKNPPAYNNAVYEADAFNMFLWDVNKFKNIYASTDTELISVWFAEYDYKAEWTTSVANTPYYTETLFHLGLLNPEPFLAWIYDYSFESVEEYNKRIQVVSEILFELTRVAGYADRKPILIPSTWNSGFVLSGMYANGRNLWRVTPDTTDGMTLEKFKVKDSDPTFSIGGQTVTFPQGKIIADGQVSQVGTAGYWIETPKNVTPIITNVEDRYSQYPSFSENFEGYDANTTFNVTNARPASCWNIEGTKPTVQVKGNNKVLAMTGTAELGNIRLPQNITAGDGYAKQQAWQVTVTLSENLNTDAEIKLLTSSGDGGVKIADGKVYYDEKGSYKPLEGVNLSANTAYTVKREMDFRTADAFTCTYSVYDATGKCLGEAKALPVTQRYLPATKIAISCKNVTGQVLLDDYKLYPTGVAADFEVYNAKTGIMQTDSAKASGENVAYRLSWLNGTDKTESREVVATFYDAAGKQLSQQTVKKVEMKPGCDSVETGIVEVKEGQKVVLSVKAVTEPAPKPTQPATKPSTAPTTSPTTAPTTQPTSAPATNPTVAPTTESTSAPTSVPTTEPTAAPTTEPATAPTAAPTETTSTEPPVAASKGSGNGVWILVILLAVAAAAGGVWAFFYWRKKK